MYQGHEAEFDPFDTEVDAQQAAEVQKRNMAPAGTYQTDPDTFGELTVTPSVQDDGRKVFAFFGRTKYAGRGDEVVSVLRFRISPDARPKKDVDGNVVVGKDDLSTRLYAQAVGAYTKAHDGDTPKTLRDLSDWIKSVQGLQLRTMQGSDDLIVLNINAPRR